MFSSDEFVRVREEVRSQTMADKNQLDALLADLEDLKDRCQYIRPRTGTTVSLMASDGGNIQLEFDPFQIQVVRVVDSNGKRLCLEIVSPYLDPQELFRRQFGSDGTPQTPLGQLIDDLGLHSGSLHDLSHFMPKPGEANGGPNPPWISNFRDLMEWAALYELICYRDFGRNCLIVRDGLLCGYVFRSHVFQEILDRIRASISQKAKRDRCKLFLVGIAKKSKVLDRYNLAMNLIQLLPPGHPTFVEIPLELERKSFHHIGYTAASSDSEDASSSRSAGQLHFVRFGKRRGDRVWPVDIFLDQVSEVDAILGHLLSDASQGFPVPFYPLCLQQAHEHARIEPMDATMLQDSIFQAIRSMLPREGQTDVDRYLLQTGALNTFR